jgi:catalase
MMEVHNEVTASQMIDALNATFGRHEKRRASHAKGVFASGSFFPNEEANAFCGSSAFAKGPHRVTARFSLAGGNPNVSDKSPTARGFSVDISLSDDEHLALVAISAPVFFAASRESFVSFLAARRPDPATGKPNPDAVARSNLTHTDSEAQRRWLAAVPPSTSYATAPYFPVHTYMFTRPDGSKTPARWIFEPVEGRVGLTGEAAKNAPDHFLAEELESRLSEGPVAWRVLLQFPEAIDQLHNPTAAWPDDRKTLEIGRLSIDRILNVVPGTDQDRFVFDPTRLPQGIESAGDPIFTSRSEAYAISAERRSA